MSHFFNIPINENGIITDLNLDADIGLAAIAPFRFTDVFIYSHGWWTSDAAASANYNTFSIGFAKTLQILAANAPPSLTRIKPGSSGLAAAFYWPSVLSEDARSIVNVFEGASYFTMQHRADAVGINAGYTLLRLLIGTRAGLPPLRFNLIGHSFGCRVILSALQTLANDAETLEVAGLEKADFRVVLIQAAADAGSLATGGKYEKVLTGLPNMRMLVTTSQNDAALGTFYPRAQTIAHFFRNGSPALGFVGPQGTLPVALSRITVSPAQVPPIPPAALAGPLVVADLTPLHQAHAAAYQQSIGGTLPLGGQHSDIYLPEIYEIAANLIGN